MQKNESYISNLISSLKKEGTVVLLESQMKGHPASTTSYLAARPQASIKAYGNEIHIWDGEDERVTEANPWEALQEFRKRNQDWMFGYLAYDLKNGIENFSSKNPGLIDAPDLYFIVPGLLIEIEPKGSINVIKGELPNDISVADHYQDFSIKLSYKMAKHDYLDLVKSTQHDIFEGDYYEINLSHPVEFDFYGESYSLYGAMKKAGPVPFGSYISFDGISVCCASPERFLARKGKRLWTQPIKGTIPRGEGNDHHTDIANLRNSEKERAENLMIVDLVRNDLSRVGIPNSVKVSNLFEIQSFETVHQMVSTVECLVEDHSDSIELIKACFPMGSMTGAPKIAAIQAIEKYENYRRGIYSGAIGYMKPNGDFDFNVVIRTAIIEGDKLFYPVGGAITSDSDSEAEWEETLVKTRAITNILNHSKKPE